MSSPNGNGRKDAVQFSIRMPAPLREFVVAVVVFTVVIVSLGMSALLFKELATKPLGGYLVDNFRVSGPTLSVGTTLLVLSARWIWSKHAKLVSGGLGGVQDEIEVVAKKINGLEERVTLLERSSTRAGLILNTLIAHIRGSSGQPYDPPREEDER
jgi:hypothetical protein